MSILKYNGWKWVGRVLGAILIFVWLILVVLLILALIAAAIGFFIDGVGAAPGLLAAGVIYKMLGDFLGPSLIIFMVIMVLLIPLDAIINWIGRMIWGGTGTIEQDITNGVSGFMEGMLEGMRFVLKHLATYAKEYTFLDAFPIIDDIIDFLISLDDSPPQKSCPSQTHIGEYVKTFTEVQRDYPFGKTGAKVRQDAISIAESNVQEQLRREIQNEIDKIRCQPGCRKTVTNFTITLTGMTQVSVSTGTIWDTYSATATAKGSATIDCVSPG